MTIRQRNRGQFLAAPSLPNQRIWNTCAESAYVTVSNYVGVKSGTFETMSDVVTPDFHNRVRRGEVFFSPMSQVVETIDPVLNGTGYEVEVKVGISCAGITRKKRWKCDRGEFFSTFLVANYAPTLSQGDFPHSGFVISNSDYSSAVTEASTRVLSQRGVPSTNLFEDIAEIRQTLKLVPDLLKHANSILKKAPLDKLRSSGNAWLLYRYGIRPIVSDLAAVVDNLHRLTQVKRETTRAHSSLLENSVGVKTINTSPFTFPIQQSVVDSIDIRAMSLEEFVTSQAYESGLSLKGLLSLPWELIPYSFVADWFVNFGDLIGSLLPTPGFKHLGSCLVVRRSVATTYSVVGPMLDPTAVYNVLTSPSGTISGTRRTTMRIPALSAPGLVIKSNFRLDNLTRIADAAALVGQQILGHKRKQISLRDARSAGRFIRTINTY